MAKKKSDAGVQQVTPERAQRLFRLLNLLGQGPQSRLAITRKLRLAIRGFYRDLEVLHKVGISIKLASGRYHLESDLAASLEKLPFPDPALTLGEARLLARGRSTVHRKIKSMVDRIEK